jgi:hypothetical protein
MVMTNIKNILTTLLALFKSALESAYYQQPIPSETDDGISRVLSGLSAKDQTDLKLVSDGVTGDEARVLGLYAERMASLAVRENSVNRIKQGLMALSIYARTEDPRDVLLVLSLLHDASVKTSGNPKQVFNEVNAVFGETVLLSEFLNRSDEDKSIDAMGYEESKTTEGFLYARNW